MIKKKVILFLLLLPILSFAFQGESEDILVGMQYTTLGFYSQDFGTITTNGTGNATCSQNNSFYCATLNKIKLTLTNTTKLYTYQNAQDTPYIKIPNLLSLVFILLAVFGITFYTLKFKG